MKESVKSECGGCNQCGHCETSHEEGCQGGCQGCESSQELFYIDEYGEMDDRGYPAQLVVIDIWSEHVFFDELKVTLEQKGYEVIIEIMKSSDLLLSEADQKQRLLFRCNGEIMGIDKDRIDNFSQRQEEIKKTEQQIVAPNRNSI